MTQRTLEQELAWIAARVYEKCADAARMRDPFLANIFQQAADEFYTEAGGRERK
jgi:hypothetical protein